MWVRYNRIYNTKKFTNNKVILNLLYVVLIKKNDIRIWWQDEKYIIVRKFLKEI